MTSFILPHYLKGNDVSFIDNKIELTELEIACGVTVDNIIELSKKTLVTDNKVVFPANVSPAEASAFLRSIGRENALASGRESVTRFVVYREER